MYNYCTHCSKHNCSKWYTKLYWSYLQIFLQGTSYFLREIARPSATAPFADPNHAGRLGEWPPCAFWAGRPPGVTGRNRRGGAQGS